MVGSVSDQTAVVSMIINNLFESVLNVHFGHGSFYLISIWTPLTSGVAIGCAMHKEGPSAVAGTLVASVIYFKLDNAIKSA